RGITRVVAPTLRRRRSNIGGPCPLSNAPLPTVRYEQNCLLMPPKERSPRRSEPRTITPSRFRIGKNILPVGSHYHPGSQNLLGSVAKIVKLEHAWRRLDGRNDDGFQVAPFPG